MMCTIYHNCCLHMYTTSCQEPCVLWSWRSLSISSHAKFHHILCAAQYSNLHLLVLDLLWSWCLTLGGNTMDGLGLAYSAYLTQLYSVIVLSEGHWRGEFACDVSSRHLIQHWWLRRVALCKIGIVQQYWRWACNIAATQICYSITCSIAIQQCFSWSVCLHWLHGQVHTLLYDSYLRLA